MPVFHTKTIESILGPVADQVSRLVILHEEAEDGNGMPNLEKPVHAVSKAVDNLVRVGKQTCNSSDDNILKQDMPIAMHRVEEASKFLEQASTLLKNDPFSFPARKKLIEGARGILQGTSSLLLAFDESEVRKIIVYCKKVLEYLSIAQVIETMEDLVQYVKDLTPSLTNATKFVNDREKELTHQLHKETLQRCLNNIKDQTPLLISSMKIYIQILKQGNGVEESRANRDYLVNCMTENMEEIIRILQLTSFDEDEWVPDQASYLKKSLKSLDTKIVAAHDWLLDSRAIKGGMGEKAIRNIIESAHRISSKCGLQDRHSVKKLCGDISSLTDALCELRSDGKGETTQARALAKNIQQSLTGLNKSLAEMVERNIRDAANCKQEGYVATNDKDSSVDQASGIPFGELLKQVKLWLYDPASLPNEPRSQSVRAINLIVAKAFNLGLCDQGACDEIQRLSHQLNDLCDKREADSEHGKTIARTLFYKIERFNDMITKNLTSQVLINFLDINTPLKQFAENVNSPINSEYREEHFSEKMDSFHDFSDRIISTLKFVSAQGNLTKKCSDDLNMFANQIGDLTHQIITAGKISFHYPDNKPAEEHFEMLRHKLANTLVKARKMVDETLDSNVLIQVIQEMMVHHNGDCEQAIYDNEPHKFVENTSHIARLANRVLMIAKQESENSEDVIFQQNLDIASENLNADILQMVQHATLVAGDMKNSEVVSGWRETNKSLTRLVQSVKNAICGSDRNMAKNLKGLNIQPDCYDSYENTDLSFLPPPPDYLRTPYNETERSLLPNNVVPPRPPPPETDDEEDILFRVSPKDNQPILQAAHSLHQDVRQWSSKDNEIIAAAKRMALLMAHLSQLVRGEGGSKKDLIDCAKDIANFSSDVTRLAKELARQCTDKRMRMNLLQVCERIPTIGTQLKILSTVKATMLGAQASDEDQEATEMLVGNAQNLMQSVKDTVKAAEAASIKIRTDSGYTLRWLRKKPWYQY